MKKLFILISIILPLLGHGQDIGETDVFIYKKHLVKKIKSDRNTNTKFTYTADKITEENKLGKLFHSKYFHTSHSRIDSILEYKKNKRNERLIERNEFIYNNKGQLIVEYNRVMFANYSAIDSFFYNNKDLVQKITTYIKFIDSELKILLNERILVYDTFNKLTEMTIKIYDEYGFLEFENQVSYTYDTKERLISRKEFCRPHIHLAPEAMKNKVSKDLIVDNYWYNENGLIKKKESIRYGIRSDGLQLFEYDHFASSIETYQYKFYKRLK